MQKFLRGLVPSPSQAIAWLIALVGVIFAWRQADVGGRSLEVSEREAEYARALEIRLEYAVLPVLTGADQLEVQKTSEQLVEKFYQQVYQLVQSRPGTTYAKAVEAILPMTATLPARSLSIGTIIQNTGRTTARKVHAVLSLDRPISRLDVSSIEPSRIINGGVGQSNGIVEVDRIAGGDTVTVTVRSETISTDSQLDQLIISRSLLSGGGNFSSIFLNKQKETLICPAGGVLPCPFYVPGRSPQIKVDVTSEEGRAVLVPVPTSAQNPKPFGTGASSPTGPTTPAPAK